MSPPHKHAPLALLCLAVCAAGLPAADAKHWAFQPVRRPAVPAVRDRDWVHTPVDAFVLAELEKKGLRPNSPADRRTLLRRVSLDLIGLPPTPEEVETALSDRSPDWYEKVVDRLLADPRHGERWARHWLDVARYAETNGYERDGAKPNAWRYRDYVIDAFNKDKPFDRFLTEQLAGDEVDGSDAETQIATTFLRLGTWDDEPAEPTVDRYDQLDDVLGTVASAFLGQTLRCARCHDHKFEPFSQVDYYRMLAVFEPLKRPQNGRADLDRPVGSAAELAAFRDAQQRLARLKADRAALEAKVRKRLVAEKKTKLPAQALAAFGTDPAKRSIQQVRLVAKLAAQHDKEIRDAATAEERADLDRLAKEITAAEAVRPKELPRAYIWFEDSPKASVTHVLHRGDPARPKQEVSPGLPAALADRQPEPPRSLAHSTGRRLWLARWLTAPDNPLTARVMVNRLWQHHFGHGLVATANDFGVMGDTPTHPELLDWLTSEFMGEPGASALGVPWSLKRIHRLIVLSSAYRTSSAPNADAARIDPRGELLWRWRQPRLQAEAVRDSVLAVSGRLNPHMAGPSVYPPIPRAVLEGQSRPGDGWGKSDERQASRRSVYVYVKRVLAVPELELLDAPDNTCSCEQRAVSTTGPQALTFLNGEFMQQQARHFAVRLEREAGADPAGQVRRAFALALCRPPREEELRASVDFLQKQQAQIEQDGEKRPAEARRRALAAFCLVVLNLNEFVYVD